MTKDICSEGLSLIHTSRVAHDRLIVGLEDAVQMHFLLCHREHCTPLGYGYYQIGVHPEEIIKLKPDVIMRLQRRMQEFRTDGTAGSGAAGTTGALSESGCLEGGVSALLFRSGELAKRNRSGPAKGHHREDYRFYAARHFKKYLVGAGRYAEGAL